MSRAHLPNALFYDRIYTYRTYSFITLRSPINVLFHVSAFIIKRTFYKCVLPINATFCVTLNQRCSLSQNAALFPSTTRSVVPFHNTQRCSPLNHVALFPSTPSGVVFFHNTQPALFPFTTRSVVPFHNTRRCFLSQHHALLPSTPRSVVVPSHTKQRCFLPFPNMQQLSVKAAQAFANLVINTDGGRGRGGENPKTIISHLGEGQFYGFLRLFFFLSFCAANTIKVASTRACFIYLFFFMEPSDERGWA